MLLKMDQPQANPLLSPPELSPMEQEVLEEYERLAENMKKVRHLYLPESMKRGGGVLNMDDYSSHQYSIPWQTSLQPRFLMACASWNARRVWCSLCSRPVCTASCSSRRSTGATRDAERIYQRQSSAFRQILGQVTATLHRGHPRDTHSAGSRD